MSGQQNNDKTETLFSFELLVENIRLDEAGKVSDQLAVGVKLLDFPTLLIYQPRQKSDGETRENPDVRDEHVFNRGKCCFFKMKLSCLHTHLSNTPLYAMVLDVKEEIPKLVGTSLISLNKVMKRIRQDVMENGVSALSSYGERGLVGVCSLTGEKIGSISLSYKLQSLGGNLLSHATEGSNAYSGEHVQESRTEENKSADSPPASLPAQDIYEFPDKETLENEDKQDSSVYVAVQSEETPQTFNEDNFGEDSTIFRPPHLFFCNSAEEKSTNKSGDCPFLNPNSAAFQFEDTSSEEGDKTGGVSSPTEARRGKHGVEMQENKGTSGVTPNLHGEAVQQLPLLNALLVELSQLNRQTPQQSLSIHPNLAWIYRPASAEPSAVQNKSLQALSPSVKRLHSPRNCSTPLFKHASLGGKDKQEERKSYSTSPRKKLVFGTTKTFNLRMKQISPDRAKRRECVELRIQSETRASQVKGKKKSHKKVSKRKADVKKLPSSLNENIETVIESVKEDASLKETITLKQKGLSKQDRHSPGKSEKAPLSERDSKFIDIPSVGSDIFAGNKEEKERQSGSNQSQSDRGGENIHSSRGSSTKSSISDSAGEGNDEEDYADDFNSLEPSEAYSPDPMSSPESSRAKTPKPPVRPASGSSSEGPQRRAALPVPIKAPASPPQRTLRGTHVIRPRTQASALSFSSDDSDKDTSASLQTVLSRKQTTESSRGDRSSGADSLISSRGQRSEASRNSRAAPGISAESFSSFDLQEVEEELDELGSMDFRKGYQHISELVANKLPGYTM
ncbi:LOW QUALITY PROTEIN: microtubule-associated protein 10-like [Xyrichtys novacula]|uniref:LOW QUALITY PROTEIN: microtubule-associated protein 10-like n=1 Tax=Xyrichtys novacula TaxID=13765 RepID=A0AAV1G5J3_XYRNO|nr:LOW QUALITY PROTEIN: microtubule-associated protein 10-like [Xyrichtys novacula]